MSLEALVSVGEVGLILLHKDWKYGFQFFPVGWSQFSQFAKRRRYGERLPGLVPRSLHPMPLNTF